MRYNKRNENEGADSMEKIIAVLRANGYKITPQRRAVIQAILAYERFPTAQQILEEVKKVHPDVSLDTIYRNISLLSELGIVNEIKKPSGACVYELVTSRHHHHMICMQCGKTECLESCPLDENILRQAAAKGFEITGHIAEFYGRCSHCRALPEKVTGGKKHC